MHTHAWLSLSLSRSLSQAFFHERRIHAGLKRKLNAWFKFYFEQACTTLDQEEIFEVLPDALREELALNLGYLNGKQDLLF